MFVSRAAQFFARGQHSAPIPEGPGIDPGRGVPVYEHVCWRPEDHHRNAVDAQPTELHGLSERDPDPEGVAGQQSRPVHVAHLCGHFSGP